MFFSHSTNETEERSPGGESGGGYYSHRGRIIRRIVHSISPVFLVYYILPDPVPVVWLSRVYLLLVLLGIMTVVEFGRLASGKVVYGLRHYEARRPASYYYGAVAMVISFSLFPWWIAAPSVITVAWVDPFCGMVRRRGLDPLLSLVPALMVFGLFYLLVCPFLLGYPAATAALVHIPLGAGAAILAEWPQLEWVDDDMLMFLAPEVAIWLAALVVGAPVVI
ncbi:MAG: hypothetical protein J7L61_04300 [Thermoplasmata archaeon]|nr:hypothetical protein [Thermoplasmata archaeon]